MTLRQALASLVLLTLLGGPATISHAQPVSVPRADAIRFLRQEYQVYTPCKKAAFPAIEAWGPSGDRDAVSGVLSDAELACGKTLVYAPMPDDLQHNATVNLLDHEVPQYLFYMNQAIIAMDCGNMGKYPCDMARVNRAVQRFISAARRHERVLLWAAHKIEHDWHLPHIM